jgi:hypothetical protein
MREIKVENYLKEVVHQAGGMCRKWPGRFGEPDRIVILPGRVLFVETKASDGKLSRKQMYMQNVMRSMGADVRVTWSIEDVDALMDDVRGTR